MVGEIAVMTKGLMGWDSGDVGTETEGQKEMKVESAQKTCAKTYRCETKAGVEASTPPSLALNTLCPASAGGIPTMGCAFTHQGCENNAKLGSKHNRI